MPAPTAPYPSEIEQLRERAALYQPCEGHAQVFHVEFAAAAQVVQTAEGAVRCIPGDAIVQDASSQDRWPVQAAVFADRYAPAQGQSPGVAGAYRKRHRLVRAAQLRGPFEHALSGERGTLRGDTTDWVVWYDDGKSEPSDQLGIVRHDLFVRDYELARVPVYVDLLALDPSESRIAREALRALNAYLPDTPLLCDAAAQPAGRPDPDCLEATAAAPIWFRVVSGDPRHREHAIAPVLEIRLADLRGTGGPTLVTHLRREGTWWRYLAQGVGTLLRPCVGAQPPTQFAVETVAAQLAETQAFNAELAAHAGGGAAGSFISHRQPQDQPGGLERLVRIGAVADRLSIVHQIRWQRLCLSTTSEIAATWRACSPLTTLRMLALMLRHATSLSSLGVIAAIALAAGSEFSGQRLVPGGSVPWLAIYAAALAWAMARFAHAKSQKWEHRHQDLRLLAEWLRVVHVQVLLGRPCEILRSLMPRQHADSGWVRQTLRSLLHAQPLLTCDASRADARRSWVHENFVHRQVSYHRDTLLKRREAAINALSQSARLAFLGFVGCLLGLLASQVLHHGVWHTEEGWPTHLLAIGQLASLALWGALRRVLDVFGLEQEVQRAERVLHALEETQCAPDEHATLDACSFFARDQEEWHALHRGKPVEAPTGS